MKIILFCLFLIEHVSNNGKASIDSFAPSSSSSNILLTDNTRSSDKSCYRPCKFNVKPRRCQYKFKVEPAVQEDGSTTISINGITPGPPIHVCAGDVIVVEVLNKVPDQDITLHWHGVEQRGTPYMDGVPMVTQCPITYGSTYKYAFRASAPGTFFYHSDSVSHQSDGVYGALIVHQPQPMEPNSFLYDYDRSLEHTLLIAAKFPQLMTASLDDLSLMQPDSLIINGDKQNSKIFVIPNYAYRLRLVNAIAIECPVTVTIDQHEMLVITSDGRPVKPVSARKVQLFPGERMDVVVRASLSSGGYWVRVRSSGVCANATGNAMLLYTGFNYTSMLSGAEQRDSVADTAANSEIPVHGQKLESLQPFSYSAKVKSVYLGIDKNIVKFLDSDNDFRYISDAVPKKPFFPASLSLQQSGVVQINGKSFLYPNSPLLLMPKDASRNNICVVGEETKNPEPQCMLAINALQGEELELALVNEGFGSNDSYTFHMHGFNMQVLATWQNPDGTPISKEIFYEMEKERRIERNLETPPIKDTIVVPNKGYTIVKIRADQGGSWMIECRSCSLFSLPTAVVFNVAITLPKSISNSLPKCGSYRPPDILLN